jgi:hypothetical protein
LLSGVNGLSAEQDAAAQKVAAIKQSLQASATALRSYEWIETITVSLDGDEKSRKENRVYYGADGKEQKVPVEGGQSSGSGKTPRGIRGRIAKKKTEEMEDYVQQAMALIKQYVPPDPARLQAIKDQGAQVLEVLDNATKLRAEFPNYLKTGDLLSVDIDPNSDRIKGVSVASYLEDDAKDVVTLAVTFSELQDGTSFPAEIKMHGASKKLDVVIDNSGYRKAGS